MQRLFILAVIVAIGVGIFLLVSKSPSFQKLAKNSSTAQPTAIPTPIPSTITIDGHTFTVEIANTEAQKEQGLGDRPSLPLDHGMLFPFGTPDYYGFWMKRMKFPLDIIYFQDNKIVTIVENLPPPANGSINPTIYKPANKANLVLEINGGLSKKYNFKLNDSAFISIH